MKIGELAQMTGCTVETIRFYEKTGLMSEAQRNHANYRMYNKQHLERLCFIRNCRSLDMSHDEIRALLKLMDEPSAPCQAVNELLNEHLHHIQTRLTELTQLKAQFQSLQKKCTQVTRVEECGIVQELSAQPSYYLKNTAALNRVHHSHQHKKA